VGKSKTVTVVGASVGNMVVVVVVTVFTNVVFVTALRVDLGPLTVVLTTLVE
jgi:hypothetical protein